MKFVDLRKNFSERNGKYEVSYNNYSDIGIYIASREYYNSAYAEDMKISVTMSTEEGVVADLSVRVEVINIKKLSKRRELIAFEVKQSVAKHIDSLKSRHNNVLDIDFIKDVVSFILNYNVCNRYEVVVEDEVENTDSTDTTEKVDDTKTVDVTKKMEESIMRLDKGFEVTVNGLLKSYSFSTEEVETSYGYKDFVCKMEVKSTITVDEEYAILKAYIELYDGVVTYINIGRDNEYKQVEAFSSLIHANGVSKAVNELIDDIKYEIGLYIGEKDINFAYSILAMVLNLNSYDSNTYLYNEETYSLAQIA